MHQSQLLGYPEGFLGLANQVRRNTLKHAAREESRASAEAYPLLVRLCFQYPSVSMLNWVNGEGNPKFFTLRLLIDTLRELRNGCEQTELEKDTQNVKCAQPYTMPMPETVEPKEGSNAVAAPLLQVSTPGALFATWINSTSASRLFILNTLSTPQAFSMPSAAGCPARMLDESCPNCDAWLVHLTAAPLTLNRFAVLLIDFDPAKGKCDTRRVEAMEQAAKQAADKYAADKK